MRPPSSSSISKSDEEVVGGEDSSKQPIKAAKEEKNPSSNEIEASISFSQALSSKSFEIAFWPLPFFSRTSGRPTTTASECDCDITTSAAAAAAAFAQKNISISKKKKDSRWNSAVFYFTLILTQQFFVEPYKNQFTFSNNFKLHQHSSKGNTFGEEKDLFILPLEDFEEFDKFKMFNSYGNSEQYYQNEGPSRELFDPVIGKFQSTNFDQNDFFAPRFRWRNDAELASYAWRNQQQHQQQQPNIGGKYQEINMMLAENRVPSYGPTTSAKGAPRDPSLLDYEAIDVSWRNDIESEKNRLNVNEYPQTTPTQSQQQQRERDMYDAQYERDLQVLHEKGYIAPFTAEESTRYEELSKAQFADFYNTVARPSKGSFPSSSRFTNYSTNIPSTSVFRSSYYSSENSQQQQQSDCQRSDDGYHSNNDSGFNSNSDDERNGDDRSNHGMPFYEQQPLEQQHQHFENITLAYQPFNESNETLLAVSIAAPTSSAINETTTTTTTTSSPVLGDYTVNGPEESLETSLELDEDEYLKYVTNQQVLEDISASATEQSFEAVNEVLARVQRDHENSHISVGFTPFDEPIPFLDDDFFLNPPTTTTTSETTVAAAQSSASSSSSSIESSSVSPSLEYRMYGKLIPELKSEADDEFDEDIELDDHESSSSDPKSGQRRRGRQSKDNDLVKKHDLPATAEELAAMSHKALQNLLKEPQLTEIQKSLIKRIRRRGRNKEAARKCRERRILPGEVVADTPSTLTTAASSLSFELPTSNVKLIQRPFIVYPPTRTTKVGA